MDIYNVPAHQEISWFGRDYQVDDRFINFRHAERCCMYLSYGLLLHMYENDMADNFILGISEDLQYLYMKGSDVIQGQSVSRNMKHHTRNNGKPVMPPKVMREWLRERDIRFSARYSFISEENNIMTFVKKFELGVKDGHFPKTVRKR